MELLMGSAVLWEIQTKRAEHNVCNYRTDCGWNLRKLISFKQNSWSKGWSVSYCVLPANAVKFIVTKVPCKINASKWFSIYWVMAWTNRCSNKWLKAQTCRFVIIELVYDVSFRIISQVLLSVSLNAAGLGWPLQLQPDERHRWLVWYHIYCLHLLSNKGGLLWRVLAGCVCITCASIQTFVEEREGKKRWELFH